MYSRTVALFYFWFDETMEDQAGRTEVLPSFLEGLTRTMTVFGVGGEHVVLTNPGPAISLLLADLVTGRRMRYNSECAGLFSSTGYMEALRVAPFNSIADDREFAQTIQAKLATLEDIAQLHYQGALNEDDVLLAMNIHMLASATRPGPPKLTSSGATAPPRLSTVDYPPALSAYGIYGLARKVGNAYYSENQSFRNYMDTTFGFRPYTYKEQSKIEVLQASDLPSQLLPYAVENDVWGILLGDVKLYEKNRNYPLEMLWPLVEAVVRALSGSRRDKLEEFQSRLVGIREANSFRELADQMEGARFTSAPRDRTCAMTAQEARLYNLIQTSVIEKNGEPEAKRHRVDGAEQLLAADDDDDDIQADAGSTY